MNKINFWVKYMPAKFQLWYWTFPNGQMIEGLTIMSLATIIVGSLVFYMIGLL